MTEGAVYLKRAEPAGVKDTGELEGNVKAIIADVRARGDDALREYARRFDGYESDSFRVPEEQIEAACRQVSPEARECIDFARQNIERFARLQLAMYREFEEETLPGVHLGQRVVPVARAGLYVPGGRFPLLSSPLMLAVPAMVAGVPEVVACTPPRPDGSVHAAVLYALHTAGVKDIFALGGAQAVAAMAYGTGSVPRVDIIAGPGNRYVTEAKRQVFGDVGIDLIAGPSEILVVSDDSGDPEVIAADLLGQCEHDPWARGILITTSEELARQVMAQVELQLQNLPTREVASASWARNGEVVVVSAMEEALALADEYAPEHLEVHARDALALKDKLSNYGSLFLGEGASVVFSDKNVGTNHVLPTGAAARYTGGLWVGTFLKVITHQWLSEEGIRKVAPLCVRQSGIEGLAGHGRSAAVRLERLKS